MALAASVSGSVSPGRDDELGPRRQRVVEVAGVEHRAGPDDGALDAGHLADHLEGRRGAQGDFQGGEPALDQGLGDRGGLGHVIDHQDRNDGHGAHERVDAGQIVHGRQLLRISEAGGGEHGGRALLGRVGPVRA